jgi:hypothetical protein
VKHRYRQEQIIAIRHEEEGAGSKAAVCRKYRIFEQSYYRWRHLCGGLQSPRVLRLKHLEVENDLLKMPGDPDPSTPGHHATQLDSALI